MRRAPAPSRRRDGLVYSPGAGRNIECVAAAGRSIYTGARAYGGGGDAGGGGGQAEGEVLQLQLPVLEAGPLARFEGGVVALAVGAGWLAACCGRSVEWLRLQT